MSPDEVFLTHVEAAAESLHPKRFTYSPERSQAHSLIAISILLLKVNETLERIAQAIETKHG
jgi:hypothetical protein